MEEQCHDQVWSLWGFDDLVELTVYIESLCPDCKEFINGQLWSTYIKLASIMNVRVVPYGNANVSHAPHFAIVLFLSIISNCDYYLYSCCGGDSKSLHSYQDSNFWLTSLY